MTKQELIDRYEKKHKKFSERMSHHKQEMLEATDETKISIHRENMFSFHFRANFMKQIIDDLKELE